MNEYGLSVSPCGECPIDEKIYQCCFRDPETGRSEPLTLDDGNTVLACPYLSVTGLCIRYRERPMGCRDFICDRFRTARVWGLRTPGDFFIYS